MSDRKRADAIRGPLRASSQGPRSRRLDVIEQLGCADYRNGFMNSRGKLPRTFQEENPRFFG